MKDPVFCITYFPPNRVPQEISKNCTFYVGALILSISSVDRIRYFFDISHLSSTCSI